MSKKVTHHLPDKTGQEHLGLERIVFFSDAVFAIAITLLALEIRLPGVENALTENGLTQALISIWPKYLGYGIGFMTIGIMWMSHHRKFRFIQSYDRNLMFLNLFFLMFIAFIPFATAIISEYGNRTSTIFYAIVVSLAGIASFFLWWYASYQNRLIDPNLDSRQRRRETQVSLVVITIFAGSIGLAFINADLAKFSWLLIAIAVRR
ncbi:MAG: DUF1211 domain-containing protein [Caldilineaceae bacterium]|nr:DUF1211 domain-containing protein [Caldilineaceae bacterium]